MFMTSRNQIYLCRKIFICIILSVFMNSFSETRAASPDSTADTLLSSEEPIPDSSIIPPITNNSEDITDLKIKIAYLHVGIGGAFYSFHSKDINNFMKPFKIGLLPFGLLWSYNAHVGIRNILQIEYRVQRGSGPSLKWSSEPYLSGGKITVDVVEVEMKPKSKAIIYKLNMFI